MMPSSSPRDLRKERELRCLECDNFACQGIDSATMEPELMMLGSGELEVFAMLCVDPSNEAQAAHSY